MATVSKLVESAKIAHLTAAQSGLDAKAVAGHLEASSEPGVQIINLTAKASSGERAASIANSAVTVLRTQIPSAGMLGPRAQISVTPLDRASAPSTPLTPNLLLNLLLGGLLGLIAGIAISSVRKRLDGTLRFTDQIERELQVGILGTLPRVRRSVGRKGALGAWRRRPIAQPVRAAVAALAPLTDAPDRRLLVTSAYQDDSKAFVSALISLALAEQYYRVTAIEADFQHPSLGDHFPGGGEYTLQQLLPKPNLLLSAQGPLRIVSADQANPELSRAMLRSAAFGEFLATTRDHSDLLVIDGPPVLVGAGLSALSAECDAAVLVVQAGSTGLAHARRAVQVLDRLQLPIAGVIVADALDTGGRAKYSVNAAPALAPAPALQPAIAPANSPARESQITDDERYASSDDEAVRVHRGPTPDRAEQGVGAVQH